MAAMLAGLDLARRLGGSATRGRRRRTRDLRTQDLRAFGERRGWRPLGLVEDLSGRYPVPALQGASSARAELAVSGTWEQWPALVTTVLVQPLQSGSSRRRHDAVLQLSMLDTGPLAVRFTADLGSAEPEVVLLAAQGAGAGESVRGVLALSARRQHLRTGDHLAAVDRRLVHVRSLTAGERVLDLDGPLAALAALAIALEGPLQAEDETGDPASCVKRCRPP